MKRTDQFGRFEILISAREPVESLRQHALELSNSGTKREEIYRTFLAFHELLQSQGKEAEVATIGDVMDMIMDTYSPFNLNLPR